MAKDWRRFLPRFRRTARRTVRNPQKLAAMVSGALRKAEAHQSKLEVVWQDLQTMLRLVRAFVAGDYRKVSFRTLVAIVAGVAYFLSPFDAIVDVVPVLGLLDDVAVLGFVVSEVRAELHAFRQWETQHRTQELEAVVRTPALNAVN